METAWPTELRRAPLIVPKSRATPPLSSNRGMEALSTSAPEKVGEGRRRSEKVREGQRRSEKVISSSRGMEA